MENNTNYDNITTLYKDKNYFNMKEEIDQISILVIFGMVYSALSISALCVWMIYVMRLKEENRDIEYLNNLKSTRNISYMEFQSNNTHDEICLPENDDNVNNTTNNKRFSNKIFIV